jgi:hypothetical protein
MRKFFFLLLLFTGFQGFSQKFKDTTFSVREFTCTCKYDKDTIEFKGIFDRSEQPAYYPGGESEWKKFLKKNLNNSFKGKHKVEIRFGVDKNGNLFAFEIMNRAPAQKFEEVVRVLKLSGKWFPAMQNGFCVRAWVWLALEL